MSKPHSKIFLSLPDFLRSLIQVVRKLHENTVNCQNIMVRIVEIVQDQNVRFHYTANLISISFFKKEWVLHFVFVFTKIGISPSFAAFFPNNLQWISLHVNQIWCFRHFVFFLKINPCSMYF